MRQAHCCHYITDDPLGILSEKKKLNYFGFGYAAVLSWILRDSQAQVFKFVLKTTNKWSSSLSAVKILQLLLLLLGDVHLNPGSLFKSMDNPVVQDIIPLQSEPPAVTGQLVIISMTLSQLTEILMLEAVRLSRAGVGTAYGSRLDRGDICQWGFSEDTWTGGRASRAIAAGNSVPSCRHWESTGALGPSGLVQQLQLHSLGLEGNTALCCPMKVTLATVVFDHSKTTGFDTGVSFAPQSHLHSIPTTDCHSYDDSPAIAGKCQQKWNPRRAKTFLTNRAMLKQTLSNCQLCQSHLEP